MRSICCAIVVAGFSFAPSAQAGVIINIDQAGSDVVAIASGTLNLAGLTLVGFSTSSSRIEGSIGGVILGPTSTTLFEYWTDAVGPPSFGSVGFATADSGSGPIFGLQGNAGYLFTPSGYVSGTFLLSTDTWSNTTLAALGLTPGTYVYSWISTPPPAASTSAVSLDDSVTVNIGTPEPASIRLLSAGLLALGLLRLRRAV